MISFDIFCSLDFCIGCLFLMNLFKVDIRRLVFVEERYWFMCL